MHLLQMLWLELQRLQVISINNNTEVCIWSYGLTSLTRLSMRSISKLTIILMHSRVKKDDTNLSLHHIGLDQNVRP